MTVLAHVPAHPHSSSKPSRLGAAALLACVLALGACASKGTTPVVELTQARAALSQAESAGAQQMAPVELLAARDKLGKAEAAVREERFADARRLAEQVQADAEVAERRTRAAKAQRAVEELQRANTALEREAQRKP